MQNRALASHLLAVAMFAALAAVPSAATDRRPSPAPTREQARAAAASPAVRTASLDRLALANRPLAPRARPAAPVQAATAPCPVATSPAGDSHLQVWAGTSSNPGAAGLDTGRNIDSLDLRSLAVGTSAMNITAVITVQSLQSGPGNQPDLYGQDQWFFEFRTGSASTLKRRFLAAKYPAASSPPDVNVVDPQNPDYVFGTLSVADFTYGWLDKDSGFVHRVGFAKGAIDPAAGTITISAPISAFGLQAGDLLGRPSAFTKQTYFDTPVLAHDGGDPKSPGYNDHAGPGHDLTVGGPCA